MNAQLLPLAVALSFAFMAGSAFADDDKSDAPKLPKPPKGFEWKWCKEVKVGLLKPEGWHFKEQKKNETRGYFISKEEIKKGGEFKTGLSLNVIPGIRKKQGLKPSEYAAKFVREILKTRTTILQVIRPGKAGPVTTAGCRIKRDGSIIHYFLIADDAGDRLFLFSFESPEEDWKASWKTGETLLQKLVIDFPEAEGKPEK